MPNLPTINVPQAQFDRITAAFPGDTSAAKVAAYQAWLTNRLIDEVERVETRELQEAANADLATKLDALRSSLPARLPYPPEKT